MNKHSYIATLSANIELSDSDFNLLLESARNHYDNTVNSTIRVGGNLYGAKNRREFSNGENKFVEFSESQLGLALKSLEYQHRDDASMLYVRLYGIVREMHAKWKEINDELKVT